MSTIGLVAHARRAGLGDALVVRAGGHEASIELATFGPGDVIGVERTELLRRAPAPGAIDVPPNMMPFVELRSPDLPWRMSSGPTPWLALLIREAPEVALIASGGPLPAIQIPGDQLPRWDERGLWCHAQVGADGELEGGFARVVAPRRLAPRTRYVACLVPCYESARLAGLGLPVPDPRAEAPSWTAGVDAFLPVYDHWYFTTGDAGDFEALARRLKPAVLRASARPSTVDYGAAGATASRTPLFTALVPTDYVASAPPDGTAPQLDAWLDGAGGSAPMLGPPVYGASAGGATLPATGWRHELNLGAHHRAAAGLGAEAVRETQDELVAEAWNQLGDLRRANRERDLARLAALVHARWTSKHVAPLTAGAQVLLAANGLHRLRQGATPLGRQVDASTLPRALLSPRFRRWRARLPRGQRGSLDGLVAAVAAAPSRLGEPPPTPKDLATTATLGDLLAKFAAASVPDKDSPWAERRDVVLAEAEGLRAQAFDTVVVDRPQPLALATVAAVATAALTESRALARQEGRFEPGDAVTQLDATRPLVGEVSLEVPVSELLRRRDARFLIASVDIPPDAVGVLRPNAPFIEAVMVGANDELMRELRWRGAAVAPQATPLGRFFDVRGRGARPPREFGPVAPWAAGSSLGAHLTVADVSVMVVRGELVRRFADAVVYAAPAERVGARRRPSATGWREPMFRGMATDDTMFVGIDRTPAQLRSEGGEGWYLVLAERPAGTWFGLDEGEGGALETWNDLTWGHVALAGGYVSASARVPVPSSPGGVGWAVDGAHQAAITRQRPMRVAFHAADLIPEGV
ncbi:MAG: hypothetical protein R3B06_11945 [Kofleriaceae bacterium]